MDVVQWVSTGVAVVAAGIAGWQAWEARLSRKGSEVSSTQAAEQASRATDAAERSAAAHEDAAEHARRSAAAAAEAAEAQATLADYASDMREMSRRQVRIEWAGGDMIVVNNDTPETITNVRVEPASEAERIHRYEVPEVLASGQAGRFLGTRGGYVVSWTGVDGRRRQRTEFVRKGR